MVFSCPNRNLPEWKALVKKVGYAKAYEMYVANDFDIPSLEQVENVQPSENVNFVLKAAELLNSQKAIDTFAKGKKVGWSLEKILTELAVPKEQKTLLLGYGEKSREDLLTSLLANYSHVIEIKTAQLRKRSRTYDGAGGVVMYDDPNGANTAYYSNLTVPGGTNYEENRIITPTITPSIKGHPQFAEDNDIGWFRSDTKTSDLPLSEQQALSRSLDNPERLPFDREPNTTTITNTRRILEIQSDLFQKGRDREELTGETINGINYSIVGSGDQFAILDLTHKEPYDVFSTKEEAQRVLDSFVINSNKKANKFLQLLNKESNWVTFFVKSIIQDSVKKGYKKLLFPKGETAAKIEGHQTLADEISEINDLLAALKENFITRGKDGDYQIRDKGVLIEGEITKELLEQRRNKKIEQLEKRKEELKSQGIEKLKPIEGFYEKTLSNILNKLGTVKVITDEYGNQWNELDLSDSKLTEQTELIFLQAKNPLTQIKKDIGIKGPSYRYSPLEIQSLRRRIDSYNKKHGSKHDIAVEQVGSYYLVTFKPDDVQLSLLQKETLGVSSEAIDNTVIRFLNSIGVKVNSLEEVKATDAEGNELSIVAKARILAGIVEIAQGKRGEDTLSEEAAHFLVELLGESHPLVKQMLAEVERYGIYGQTVSEYGDMATYSQDKIRKEAVGKLIAQIVVAKSKGEPMPQRVEYWWESLWRWIKSKFSKMNLTDLNDQITSFEKAADMILQNDTRELKTLDELRKEKKYQDYTYYQMSTETKEKRRTVLQQLKEEVLVKSKLLNKYFVKDSGAKVKSRVTDLVKQISFDMFGTIDKGDERSKNAARWGVFIHAIMQEMVQRRVDGRSSLTGADLKVIYKDLSTAVDENGQTITLKEFADANEEYFTLNKTDLQKLQDTIDSVFAEVQKVDDRIIKESGLSDEEKAEMKSVFLPEHMIYSETRDLAGTVDLLVMHPDGSFSLFDWKSMSFEMMDGTFIAGVSLEKQLTYHAQLETYKSILEEQYNTHQFALSRIVPINAKFQKNGRLQRLDTHTSTKNEKLAQIATSIETVEDAAVNKQLQELIDRRTKLFATFKNDRRNTYLKREIEKIDSIIQSIQQKRDFSLLANLVDDIEEKYKALVARNADEVTTLDEKHRDLISWTKDVQTYQAMLATSRKYLRTSKPEGYQEQVDLLSLLSSRVGDLLDDLDTKHKDLLRMSKVDPDEVLQKTTTLGRLFNPLSRFKNSTIQAFSKIIKTAHEETRRFVNSVDERIKNAQKQLKEAGISVSDADKMIYNERSGRLVGTMSAKFFDDMEKAREDNDVAWFLKHTMLESVGVYEEGAGSVVNKYRFTGQAAELFKKRRERYKSALEAHYSKDVAGRKKIEELMTVWDSKHNPTVNINAIFTAPKSFFRYNGSAEYVNDTYKSIMAKPALKNYYETLLGIVTDVNEMFEPFDEELDEHFVPNIQKSMLENLMTTGLGGVGMNKDLLLKVFELRDIDPYKGVLMTAEGDKKIPLLFSDELREPLTDKEREKVVADLTAEFNRRGLEPEGVTFEQALRKKIAIAERVKGRTTKSSDLSRSFLLFAHTAAMYSQLSQQKGTIDALQFHLQQQARIKAENESGENFKNTFTNKVMNVLGVPTDEAKLLNDFIDLYVYGKQISDDREFTIGGRKYSANKIGRLVMRGMVAQTMALKPILGFSNLAGALSNVIMYGAEGRYYTGKQVWKSFKMLSSGDKKAYALIRYLEPYAHDLTLEKANKLSSHELTKWINFENLFVFLREGDKVVDGVIATSMVQNYGLSEDGQIKRLDQLPAGTKSLYDLAELTEDGKLVIKGLTDVDGKANLDTFTMFRQSIRSRANDTKGSMADDDKNLVGTSILGSALMMYRNWMPGLIRTRYKKFGANAEGEFDVGRMRVMFGEFHGGFTTKVTEFGKLMAEATTMGLYKKSINQKAVDYYYKKAVEAGIISDQKNAPNFLDKTEFVKLRTAKIRGVARELQIYLGLLAMWMLAHAMIPEDKDDPMRKVAVIGYRLALRSYMEVGFFTDPSSTVSMLKSAVPQMTTITRTIGAVKATAKDLFDLMDSGTIDTKGRRKPALQRWAELTPGVYGITDFFDVFDSYQIGSEKRY